MTQQILSGARIFDGTGFLDGQALVIENGIITELRPAGQITGAQPLPEGSILAPGFVDLQVNGGGGIMLGGDSDLAAIRHICAAHRRLGTAGLLPTLITDTPAATARVIAAGMAAARENVPGFLGLHLEGPHLDPRRKGAHEAALIRPMGPADLAQLCAAARALPALLLTIAPEAVSLEQLRALVAAGAVVSLGHSDCDYDTAQQYFAAGARGATHLFNAMSPLGSRAPGLAGAVLAGTAQAGLIADGLHVHPATLRIALAARPHGLFLVSDSMAVAGTDLGAFDLGGRRILRGAGRLTLADGTLAGADLTLDRAVAVLVHQAGIAPERALAMASRIPAELIGQAHRLGHIAPGRAADLVVLDRHLALTQVFAAA